MARAVRMFPIRSIDALKRVATDIDAWDAAKKVPFFAMFGESAREEWYVRTIGKQAYVIAISEGPDLERGFDKLATATDEFSVWFRERVLELTEIDLGAAPHDPRCEHIYTWGT